MKRFITGAAIAALAASSLSAGTVAAPVGAITAPALALTLDQGTQIMLVVGEDISSTTHDAGDTFKLTVADDVKLGNTVVIPRGSPALAEITWRTGKGAFGKSGKMEFSLRYVEVGGQRIPLTGDFRQEGEGNTVATGVGVLAVGVFAGFITGKRAKLPAGRELSGRIASAVPFNNDGSIASSYDSGAAMDAANAVTPLGKCRAEAAKLKGKGKQDSAARKCYTQRL